ncbi:unnamed protein product [Mycena citricolor]|nr:unnamed protein product [Mycena citricolor]
MVEEVVDVHGGLDVMVANAGVAPWGSILKVDATEWDRVMAVNIRGTFLCYKYAGRQMVAQGRGGRIIGASSVAGKMGFPFLPAYCASKFAVMGLTQATAQELGKHGITVNAYAPGPLNSELMQSLASDSPQDTGTSVEEWTEFMRKMIPMGRFGDLTDISDLVSFLASSGAKHITGQNISVNGGSHCS